MTGRRGALADGRLLLFALGVWCALSFAMGFVATGNFHVVEPAALRNSTEIYAAIPLEGDARRMALRYVASELNRFFFARYDLANVALAALCTWLVFLLPRRKSQIALVACLLVALASAFWLTPTIVELGRQIDFMPRDPKPPEVVRFYELHGVSISLGLLQLALALGVAIGLLREPREA
ncbi:MAG: hypothetical protein H6825_05295 [Planctomycetes bacterium]|nr:hypothetical protein [Planctomycetota bacterium]